VAPEIRYAKSGDVHIAYQVFGNGPGTIIIIPGFISHIEHSWDSPDQARWLNHLARRAQVVIFDKRGTGLSDRLGQLPNLDQRMDDDHGRVRGRIACCVVCRIPPRAMLRTDPLRRLRQIFGLVSDQTEIRWIPELRWDRLGHRQEHCGFCSVKKGRCGISALVGPF
jgi:pimeloyl-ACP methyl ester carboxylesterase